MVRRILRNAGQLRSQSLILGAAIFALHVLNAAVASEEPKKEATLLGEDGVMMGYAKRAREYMEEGQQLFNQGKYDDALELFVESSRRIQTMGTPHLFIGMIKERQKLFPEAIKAFEESVRLGNMDVKHMAQAHNYLAKLYEKQQSRDDAAEEHYRLAIENDATFVPAHKNLFRLLMRSGRSKEAREHMEIAAELDNDDALRFQSALLLPDVYMNMEDKEYWRSQLHRSLDQLATRKMRIPDPFRCEEGPLQHLSHQGWNNAEISANISRLFRAANPEVTFRAPFLDKYSPPKDPKKKIRVGFFSGFFGNHAMGNMMLGLLDGLDRKKFYIVVFNIGGEDDETARFEFYCDKSINLLGNSLERAQLLISREKMDVMVMAEVGMDPRTYAVAHSRLAPVQVAIGLTSSTGIDTLDYFVSYKGIAEPHAQSHYTETLMELEGQSPLLRFHSLFPFEHSRKMYKKKGVTSFRRRLELPTNKTIYACFQNIPKLSPEMDDAVKGILEADPAAVIAFREMPASVQPGHEFRSRLQATLSSEQMERVHFLSYLSDQDYRDAFRAVDVVLDSFPVGGHISSMDALSTGVPVVTFPSALASGRSTQAFYGFMGIKELIASSVDEFISIAVGLGTNKSLRADLSTRIAAGSEQLKEDMTSSQAWNRFLVDVVKFLPNTGSHVVRAP